MVWIPKMADKNLYVMDTTDKPVDSTPFLIDSSAQDGLAAQTGG
ncbi:hypothetical protein VYF65_001682 [Lysinibacillus irui]